MDNFADRIEWETRPTQQELKRFAVEACIESSQKVKAMVEQMGRGATVLAGAINQVAKMYNEMK